MNDDIEIITKADKNFFKGLKSLIESLCVYVPNIKRTVVDCGLTEPQINYCLEKNCKIQLGKVDNYKIQDNMKHYYTPAIYGFFDAVFPRNKIIIHLDADAILLGNLDQLVNDARKHGLAAVPDYPPLYLEDQIKNPSCINIIRNSIPNLNLKSIAFNAGVFAIKSNYYLDEILPVIKELMPIHDQLWSNDQALLNLSAFKVNSTESFKNSGYIFNTRPKYNRSPNTPSLKLLTIDNNLTVEGIGGIAHIIHYVGNPKPWDVEYDKNTPGYLIWEYYYNLGNEVR